jgi:uncharacterized membrane protein YfcA
MSTMIVFLLLAFIAEVLGTIGGFGSSMFFVPLAGFFLDFHKVLGITALFHVSSNISKIALFRQSIDRRLVLNIGVPAILFVIAGAWLSSYFDSNLLELILGIFLVSISAFLLSFRKLVIKPTRFNTWFGGAVSGGAAGMLGTGGAIRGLTLAAFALDKNVFIATSAFIDLGIDLSRSVVYIGKGYVQPSEAYLVLGLLIVSFFGTLAGKSILKHISQNQFRSMVMILILMIGIITLVKQLF